MPRKTHAQAAKRAKQRKYTVEDQAKAYDLYCSGLSINDIANKTKIPARTLNAWKSKREPRNWVVGRKDRAQMMADMAEDRALENWEKTLARQQKLNAKVMERLAKRICESANKELPVPEALKHFPKTIDTEREMYMEKEEVVRLKHKVPGVQVGVGAQFQTSNKEATVRTSAMAFLTGKFQELHGGEQRTIDGEITEVIDGDTDTSDD